MMFEVVVNYNLKVPWILGSTEANSKRCKSLTAKWMAKETNNRRPFLELIQASKVISICKVILIHTVKLNPHTYLKTMSNK